MWVHICCSTHVKVEEKCIGPCSLYVSCGSWRNEYSKAFTFKPFSSPSGKILLYFSHPGRHIVTHTVTLKCFSS